MHTLIEPSQRKTWTRDEAAKLADLFPGQRYELIQGDLIDKMGQKPPHAYIIAMLSSIFGGAFPGKVRIQLPITLPDPDGIRSEPEPDVAILNKGGVEFFHRHPSPQDIALLIEVADSTFHMDHEIKRRLYARSGINVYWIVDIQQRRIIVFQTPSRDEYKLTVIHEGDEQVSVGALNITVRDLFVGSEIKP